MVLNESGEVFPRRFCYGTLLEREPGRERDCAGSGVIFALHACDLAEASGLDTVFDGRGGKVERRGNVVVVMVEQVLHLCSHLELDALGKDQALHQRGREGIRSRTDEAADTGRSLAADIGGRVGKGSGGEEVTSTLPGCVRRNSRANAVQLSLQESASESPLLERCCAIRSC